MVEQVDLAVKKEDKASNEVVDDVKKVAMEGVDKGKEQVAMEVANTKCLDDLIDNLLLQCNVKDADDESNNDDDNADHHIVIFHQLYFCSESSRVLKSLLLHILRSQSLL